MMTSRIDHSTLHQTCFTLGELKKAQWVSRSVKDEMRENLILNLKRKTSIFEGIRGYENTVIPAIERAILARHNINFLGLRGQAKTRIARTLVALLDEYMPVVAVSDLNEDPLNPISRYAKDIIAEKGDATPVEWVHRDERYTEKLATPDVTVADLIGDVDPIKAANLKLSYADERVLHFGLVPRANRGLFVINELPDLQPRIQVALFNILQEGDIQIRGFKLRLDLDVQFVFTANPEDYTNRGAIITPLKDRIQSQIITHYPESIDISREITQQEAHLVEAQRNKVQSNELLEVLNEQLAFIARNSELIDQKSGVSARLTISAWESIVSSAERRALMNNEPQATVRIADLYGALPAITGKVELVYEGEQEGAAGVAHHIISQAIRTQFAQRFPDPESIKRRKTENPYTEIIEWFAEHELELMNEDSAELVADTLNEVSGLTALVDKYCPNLSAADKLVHQEFVLHGLAEFSLIGKDIMRNGLQFSDLMNAMFSSDPNDYEDDE